MNKKLLRKTTVVFTAMLAGIFMVLPVRAMTTIESEGIDRDKTGNITVERPSDRNWPVQGTVFHLYKVADLNDDMTFSWTEEFGNKAKEIVLPEPAQTHGSKWEDTTDSLLKVVHENDIKPLKTITWTSESITFNHLNVGLYLLTTDDQIVNGKKYESQGNLIPVPYRAVITDPWSYDIPVEVKYTEQTVRPTPTPTASPSTPVPSKPTPDTGDHFKPWLYVGVIVLMSAVTVIVIQIRNKEKEN